MVYLALSGAKFHYFFHFPYKLIEFSDISPHIHTILLTNVKNSL